VLSHLYDTPAMLFTSLLLLGIECASLLFAAVIIADYAKVNRRTAALVRSIGGSPPHTRGAAVAYAVMTLVIVIVTGLLYVFQPHLL
jgi:hypothetical protein